MAEVVVSALVGTIVTNLSNEALKQYGLLAGFDTELQKLSDSFDLIKDVIYDAEAKQWNSGREGEAVKNWLRLLKDAAYDADDVIEELQIEVERRQHQRGFKKHAMSLASLHHNPIGFRVKMARKLKSVRDRLDFIDGKRPPGLNVGSPQGVLEWRLTTSLVDDSEICGRVDEKKKLITDLISSSEALSVHAVCGMGGLGKTTLAQLVYNDAEKIKTHFPLRMWVCVSDDTDIKSLTRAIIGGCSNSDEKEELESLQQRLSQKLGGQRFLLVLDDVWENFPDIWERSKNALRSGAAGSVVLITTRIRQVAEKMHTVSIRHMGRLSDDDSWSLFSFHAFRNGDSEEHEALKKFREGIVKKCGGVPLVLKVLGSLLQLKKEENEWSDVMESELWDLADEGEKILATLRLSYTHLPINLKQCFSYCCIYPKDYVMEKEELIQLWMANDFISYGGRKGLHEKGKEIFSELVARSFFQNVEIDCWGNTTCKMHDLLHDVAKSVMEHEIHLIQPGQSFDGAKKYRHVSVCSYEIHGIQINSKISSLHSFIPMKIGIKNEKRFSTQKYLRILRCEKLPTSLSKHLRYLNVSRSSIKRLPESISSLYKLQTLNLRDCKYLKWLPKDMKEMKSLVYLDIRDCRSLKGMPPGMGQLKGMRKLSKFVVGKKDGCKIGELKELNGLEGELSISGLCNVKSGAEAESANLMGKKMLTSLELIGGTYQNSNRIIDIEVLSRLQPHQNLKKLVISGYGSINLPNWMMDLHGRLDCLEKLEILSCGLLQSLPSTGLWCSSTLHHLSIGTCDEFITLSENGLRHLTALKTLYLSRCSKMTSLPESIQHLTVLQTLTIESCTGLTCLPDGIRGLTALQTLRIESCMGLTCLPDGIRGLTALQTLSIESCMGLTCLPDGIRGLTALQTLRIKSCMGLTCLPDGITGLTALQTLSLKSCMGLTCLPDGISGLTALQTLSIESCMGLTCLPDGISGLTALQTLSIESCSMGLTCLPDGIRDLTALQTLRISAEITCLPNGIMGLTTLQTLHLSFWEFTCLPDDIRVLTALQTLSFLCCHRLTCLPDGISGLSSLQSLEFLNCRGLTYLSDGIMGLTALQTLYIACCPRLSCLPDGIRSLTTLTTLVISKCSRDLKRRCKKEKGEDWAKIAHIPHIVID